MSSPTSPDDSAGGDTGAFQRYYLTGSENEEPRRGFLYRLLVGWWRRPA